MVKKALQIVLLLASVLLIFTACATYVNIKAEVRHDASAGYFYVENNDSYNWTDVRLTLNEVYIHTEASIPAGDIRKIADGDFAELDGTRFDFSTTKPLTILIECQTPKGTGIYEGSSSN